jgi:RNA polymerase sigma factor (sigma-70 family)
MSRPDGLTSQQERELVVAAEAGDPYACRQLIETFLPQVTAVARRFRNSGGVEWPDLVQEGIAALLFAARRYDVRLDTPFWAYASFWVRKGLQELTADAGRAFAMSDRAVRDLASVRAARSEYYQAHGREPTMTELAAATGHSRPHVEQLLAADRGVRSLEAGADPAGDADAPVARLADPSAAYAFDVVLDELELRHVRSLADALEERERAVVRAHFGLGEPARTLGQIGAVLGVSAERARQIEATALTKLRMQLARPALSPNST